MSVLKLKPTHKPVLEYYDALEIYAKHGITHETAVRNAFQTLLTWCSRKVGWQFFEEKQWTPKGTRRTLFVDGVIVDSLNAPHAWWEAKDENDDLATEAKKKLLIGYPDDNIIFQSPTRAILYQSGLAVFDEDITRPKILVDILHEIFRYRQDWQSEWEQAVEDFKDRIPDYADALRVLIEKERPANAAFSTSFAAFSALCKSTINPNIREEAIEEMLIQHLLTKRIFATVFRNPEFVQRNPVAREIGNVVAALTSRNFSEAEFLKGLERFYYTLERYADHIPDYATKQQFLNAVYERFFQGFSKKDADTHGIVYTPQPIVDFMVRSVDEILKKEFGRSLGSPGVHILDPFVGTGNFIMRVMHEIPKTQLEHKYAHELHCNEVMLLPYYIASMNIEHEYLDLTGSYKPFEGICLVDTFELAEPDQGDLFTAENTERVKKLKDTPLFVIIGNPPYNMSQTNENDNNKNRKYETLDKRVNETYSKDSSATNKNALSDVYVKAIRWAVDRIKDNGEGIVTYVSNNSFVDDITFDGFRKHMLQDFDAIYHLNLKGNARTSGERRRKEAGNVFDDMIRVSVGITFFIKHKTPQTPARVFYQEIDDYLKSPEKKKALAEWQSYSGIDWRELTPDKKGTWLTSGMAEEYDANPVMGSKGVKAGQGDALFSTYGRGVATCRDTWAYNCSRNVLAHNMQETIDYYNLQVIKFSRLKDKPKVDDFVQYDESIISWSRDLKLDLKREKFAEYVEDKVRVSHYRPFFKEYLFFDRIFNEEVYVFPHIFPTLNTEQENVAICLSAVGNTKPFHCLVTNVIPDLHLTGDSQCFPFYTYNEDPGSESGAGGTNQKENITDWALEEYRKRYGSSNPPDGRVDEGRPSGRSRGGHNNSSSESRPESAQVNQMGPTRSVADSGPPSQREGYEEITKWDIFYYIYGILHSPEYREKYAANLRRELPRIPYVKKANDFRAFSRAGERLAFLHLNYDAESPSVTARAGHRPAPTEETNGAIIPEYPLTHIENPGTALDWRVEKMRWKDRDTKTTLIYNNFLTLTGIPPEAHRYKLGNRSALDWIVDQYRIKTDKRSGITNDPNRPDDPQYIVRLIKKIVTVSLETMKVVDGLPGLSISEGPGLEVE